MSYKHPSSIVESNTIGEGTRIWHFAHVREGAEIGSNCNIGKCVYIDSGVKIADGVKIQNFATLYKGVQIEKDVFIGPAVTFTNDLYPRAFIWDQNKITSTIVKEGASIGANSTIICGVIIGKYAMIGAGSVISKNVPDFGLVYGNPAKLKGYVCYCGKKLNKIVQKKNNIVIYQCQSCNKKVEIQKI